VEARSAVGDPGRGDLVGRYLVLGRVGAGAMGVVLAAHDPELDRKVALKLLRPSRSGSRAEDVAARGASLAREARAIARLSHPSVVAIHDVGCHAGQVFLAMEFLAGGTLREWLAERRRDRREILGCFVQIGRALAAAHAAGIVHRDFKPDNVLMGTDGRPRVADFGLARLDGSPPLQPERGQPEPRLTTPVAMVGTPAYMAPEQLFGTEIDARSDQFSFGVALFEALTGERPYTGATTFEIAARVATGAVQFPRQAAVPRRLQRALRRALAPDPGDRFSSMEPLVAALGPTRLAALRRTVLAAGVAALVVGSVSGAAALAIGRRHALERVIAPRLAEMRAHLGQARQAVGTFRARRDAAFAAFDAGDTAHGEALWREASRLREWARAEHVAASQAAESAFLPDPRRAPSRAALADALFARLVFEHEQGGGAERELRSRLWLYDDGGVRRRRLDAVGRIRFASSPPGARVRVDRFIVEEGGGKGAWQTVRSGVDPGETLELEPGSYRFAVSAPGRAAATLTTVVEADQVRDLVAALPDARVVPAGFVVVPAGQFLVGSAAEEGYRRDYQSAVPLHASIGSAFLINSVETTYGDWIAFLEALPAQERARRMPRAASVGFQGEVTLRPHPGGDWELRLQPQRRVFSAHLGQPLVYQRAGARAIVRDWRRLPVSGVSWEDAQAYAAWLRSSGRVPAARLCTEWEWEHAARGADGRPYPHGFRLDAQDANFDLTWGLDARAYAPDVVGSYPASRSPYGVDDLAGNVWEWVQARTGRPDRQVAKGGAFPFDLNSCRTEYRAVTESSMRNISAGVRICADAPPAPR
jgi:formylglycine-generating enzyme required for sulfatase activity